MLHAAMALLGARKSAEGSDAPFESMEARLVLSAPTATPEWVTLTAGSMTISVRYQSDSPIDYTTLGDNDIAATGPGGFSQPGHLESAYDDGNGGTLAYYGFRAPGGRFDPAVANGTYNFGIGADAVRNTAGEGNAEGGVASYWFWFNREITMTDQRLVTGPGPNYPDIFQYDQGDDTWSFAFQQNTGYLEDAPTLVLHVTGPNGYDQTGLAYRHLRYREQPYASYQQNVTGSVLAPGGYWDYTDSGDYTVQVGYQGAGSTSEHPVMGEVVMTRTFTQDIAGPRAEVIASNVRARDWLVTVRYTPAPGRSIDLGSIGDGDIWDDPRLLGRLTQPATVNADGSVTAVYSISPGPDGWSVHDNGPRTIRTRPGEVRDGAGVVLGTGPLYTTTFSFDQPSIIGLRTLSAMVNAWDVEVSFRNVGGLLNGMTLGGNNLSLNAWINGRYQPAPVNVQFVSSSNSPDNILAIRYRITARQGFLWNGTFDVFLNAGTMTDISWGFGNFWTTMVMQFAGPSVRGLRTVSRTNTSWDVELAFNNPGSLISTSSLSSQNLLVAAPGGRSVRITLMSFVNGSDGVLRVRYRIAATTSGTALWRGTYGFSLRAGSVAAAGVGLPGQFLASMTI
jgi:hypothetical protein